MPQLDRREVARTASQGAPAQPREPGHARDVRRRAPPAQPARAARWRRDRPRRARSDRPPPSALLATASAASSGGGDVSSGVQKRPALRAQAPPRARLPNTESGAAKSSGSQTGESHQKSPGATQAAIPAQAKASRLCSPWRARASRRPVSSPAAALRPPGDPEAEQRGDQEAAVEDHQDRRHAGGVERLEQEARGEPRRAAEAAAPLGIRERAAPGDQLRREQQEDGEQEETRARSGESGAPCPRWKSDASVGRVSAAPPERAAESVESTRKASQRGAIA